MTAPQKHRFVWAAMALFLGAQLLVAQHDAAFGPEKHTHHGQPCDIQLFADHAKAPSLPSLPLVVASAVAMLDTASTQHLVFVSRAYQPALPRAPPFSVA